MAEFPALPLWTDAYLGDTTHLTTIEHGAYLLLLMTAWRSRDCLLPDDDRLLARYARCNAGQWKRLRPILEPFFDIEDGHWRQRRLTDEREAVKRHRELQSEKGKAGAQAKALKSKGRHKAGAKSGLPSAEAGVQPNASSLTHTHIPLDKESNGAAPDTDKAFWDAAKAYLGVGKASHIGKWVKEYGKPATARAITEAQLERAVDPPAYVERCLRNAGAKADDRITV